jgi:uncharacterized protein with PQ loop repeat
MQDNNFSGEDSLKLINEMIGKAKKSYVTKGTASIVWGSLIVFCSLVAWAKFRFGFYIGFDVWMLLLLALIPQIFFSVKERRSKSFKSHDESTIYFIWITFAICIFILSFYNSKFGTENSTTLVIMLYGIPTFLTGGVCRFRPMILGGLCCWALSVASIYTSPENDMLLMAASGLAAWLIPGVILFNRYQKQRRTNV